MGTTITTILTATIMEAITVVMATMHTVATAVAIGMEGITMAATMIPDITRAIPRSLSDCRFPFLSRSPLSRSRIDSNKG